MMDQFEYQTTLNNQPNYQVGINISDQLAQNQNAYNNAIGGSGGLMGAGQAAQSQATTQQVNPDQLMSQQITGLLGSGSRYLGDARQRAREAASGRGMGNSSFAAGSAERAAIQAAAPIAQFDASRYGQVADLNQQYQNQHSLQNASNQTQLQNTALAGNLRNMNSLQQMRLGQDFGAINDIRRQLFGIEDREDQQAFNAGQFDARLGFDYDSLSQQDRQYLASLGLDYDRLGFNYDQLGQQGDQFWANFGEGQYQFDQRNQIDQYLAYMQGQAPFYNSTAAAVQAAAMNPSISAQDFPAIMNSAMGGMQNAYNAAPPSWMLPPWMQNWYQSPPQSVGQQSWGAAAGLPPMGP